MDNEQIPTETKELTTDSSPKIKNSKFHLPKISFKNMNRNTVLALILAGVLLVVGVSTLLLTRKKTPDVASDESVNMQETADEKTISAVIKQQDGSFQIKSTEGNWLDGKKEDTLSEGYSLRTVGASSRLVIALEDGSELRIDANSEVTLETLRADRVIVKHLAGYTYSRVIPNTSRTYIVTSNDAKYEAQGTAFKTIATGDEQAVEVFQSSVIETNSNKAPKAGQKMIAKSLIAPTTSGKIESLDIEKVKADVFITWNRDLDAKDDKFKNDLGFLQDITPPEITLNTTDGDVIFLDPSASEGTIEISGKTETNAKVTVLSKSQSGSQPVDVTVGSDGNFTTPVLSAPIGSSVFEFVVKDKTGNTTTKTLRITFQRKSQPVSSTSNIKLTATEIGSDKVKFKWTFGNDTTAPDGVKLVYSSSEDPIYQASGTTTAGFYATALDDTLKYSDMGLNDGDTYYFKVCVYDSGTDSCGLYSTQVTVTP